MAEFAIGAKIHLAFKKIQFGLKAQQAFLEDLAHLVDDGIPLNKAVEMLARISKGVSREVAASLAINISQGKPLAEGMREWFSFNVVEIIRAGEEGGVLAETMQSAINMISSRSSTITATVSAMIYPLLVVIIACFMIIYLNESVFAQFLTIKPKEQWPEAGKRLVFLAEFIESWWWALIVIVIGMAISLQLLMKSYVGPLRPNLDRFFPFSLYRRLVAAQTLETLGLLVSNGVVFKSALVIMQHKVSPYLAMHLAQMERLLGKGKGNIAEVLSTGLIDENDLMHLRVLAEVKGFEHGLIRLGVRGAEQSMKTLRILSRMIAAALMIIGTLLVMIAISGVYQTGIVIGAP